MINKHDNSCDLSVHQIPNVLMIYGAFASDRIRFGRERKDRGHALPPQGLHNVLPVQIHGVLDGFAGSFSGEELVDGHLLVLVLLVVFEEAPDLLEAVRGELADVVVVAVLGIVGADGYDLVVLLTLFFRHFR